MAAPSKVILGATLILFLTLAIVLSLVLVLLAQLYCSLLLRRRHKPPSTSTATVTVGSDYPHQSSTPSLSTFYSQGVLRAPRNFLFPAPQTPDFEKQPHFHIPNQFHHSSAPSSSYQWPIQESSPPSATTSGGTSAEQLIYICNPIYDNEANIRIIGKIDTPFETPGSSPSRLETGEGSSSPSSVTTTPPLTPMKKLPEQGTSVCLRNVRSICTTGSDSNSNNDVVSSSSADSQCTSPSW